MALLPSWAPNLHPLVIHFPIALIIVAAFADLVDALFGRPQWLASAATTLFALGAAGAIVACLSGQQALETVLMPGMAHPIVESHRTWAFATTFYFCRVDSDTSGEPHIARLWRVAIASCFCSLRLSESQGSYKRPSVADGWCTSRAWV